MRDKLGSQGKMGGLWIAILILLGVFMIYWFIEPAGDPPEIPQISEVPAEAA